MLTIKNFFSLIALVAVVLFSNSNSAIAQTGASAETAEFVRAAKEAQEEIALLLPAVQKIREAAARGLRRGRFHETSVVRARHPGLRPMPA